MLYWSMYNYVVESDGWVFRVRFRRQRIRRSNRYCPKSLGKRNFASMEIAISYSKLSLLLHTSYVILLSYFAMLEVQCDVTTSVDGPLSQYNSSTVVSIVTTFGIGRRTDVDGIANGFVMMISHGQNYGDRV